MLYVGLDCHQRFHMIALLREGRRRPRTLKVRGSAARLIRTPRAEAGGEPLAVCFEAGVSYDPHDRLCRVARRVVVAHPARLRAIWNNKRKNDRVDAAAENGMAEIVMWRPPRADAESKLGQTPPRPPGLFSRPRLAGACS